MSHDHDHDHRGHAHSHTPQVSTENERRVLVAFWLIFGFMIVEVVGGLASGSLALLADAGHMLTDAVALALSWAAFRFGRREADPQRTFGYARLEVIAGFINALTLFAIVLWIIFEAYSRLRTPPEILTGPMLIVAVMGLVVNIVVFWWLSRGDSEHVNIKGALLHVLGDLLGSVGAIAAAIGIWVTGWTLLDPILSVLVALLILRSAWSLLKGSTHILLEGAPEGMTPAALSARLREKVEGLADVHHVHLWQITSGKVMATLHVRPLLIAQAQEVQAAVEAELASAGIFHATVAIDWGPKAKCSLAQAHDHTHAHDHE